MSYYSINKNDSALKNINDIITTYENAISNINATNDNAKTSEIVSLINNNITTLKEAKNKINDINSQIRTEMNKLKNGSELSEN